MTEKEKMLAGEVYSAVDPELLEELMATREVLYEYNSLHPSDTLRMKEILKGLLGHVADDDFLINQPFRCDYGKQISIGKRFLPTLTSPSSMKPVSPSAIMSPSEPALLW